MTLKPFIGFYGPGEETDTGHALDIHCTIHWTYSGMYTGCTLECILDCTLNIHKCILDHTLDCTLGCTLDVHKCILDCTQDIHECILDCTWCTRVVTELYMDCTWDVHPRVPSTVHRMGGTQVVPRMVDCTEYWEVPLDCTLGMSRCVPLCPRCASAVHVDSTPDVSSCVPDVYCTLYTGHRLVYIRLYTGYTLDCKLDYKETKTSTSMMFSGTSWVHIL